MPKPPIILHPNGFLQYELPSGARLHVWHPDAPQAQKVYTPIHDHTFAFESRIILGELVETVYDWTPLEGGHPAGPDGQHPGPEDYMLWAAADGILNPTITFGSLSVREVNHYLPGDMYVRGANVFHKTEAGGKAKYAATVMRKILTGQAPFPYVAIPVDVLPDNEFRRDQYEGDVLWPLVKDALDYLYNKSIGGLLRPSQLPDMIQAVRTADANKAWNDRWEELTGREGALSQGQLSELAEESKRLGFDRYPFGSLPGETL